MQITLVFKYLSGQERGITVDEYTLFREEGRIQFVAGSSEGELTLSPGDRVEIYAVGYMTMMKRNTLHAPV